MLEQGDPIINFALRIFFFFLMENPSVWSKQTAQPKELENMCSSEGSCDIFPLLCARFGALSQYRIKWTLAKQLPEEHN